MNNFRYISRKWHRDTLERNAVAVAKAAFPNVEQYIASSRYPTLPKIVVYSSSVSGESFLRK